MSLFYDPIARKPKIWIYVFFGLVPFVLTVLLFLGSQSKVDQSKKKKAAETQTDVFTRLDLEKNP